MPGDLLIAVITSSTAGTPNPGGGWLTGVTASGGTTVTNIAVFAKPALTTDPATWTFGPTGIQAVAGVILGYFGGRGLLIGGLGANAQTAPSATQWGPLSRMLEVFAQNGNITIPLSTNQNNPTTRAALASADTSFLVVDFACTLFGTGWTGDSSLGAVVTASQPLG